MFSNKGTNEKMLEGAYKKIKSYYHYNKNFVFMKQKVAELEYEEKHMKKVISTLADIMSNTQEESNRKRLDRWIKKIDFYVMPKAFGNNEEVNEMFVTSVSANNKPISKVNFFIDMPIELHLLETVWTILVGKLIYEGGIITGACYGNCIDNHVLYNRNEEFIDSINFNKNKLFKIYFNQYCAWKNNAIEAIQFVNKFRRSPILFSLDIKGFYYSVIWKFDLLNDLFAQDERYEQIKVLTDILEKIYERYTSVIKEYRELKQCVEEREYILPIGLFSSMLLANVYLAKYDKDVIGKNGVLYYGRYVDDIIVVIDASEDAENISGNNAFEQKLVEGSHILEGDEQQGYCIAGYPNLVIQREKVKMIYFEYKSAKSLLSQLRKTMRYPSQMNIIPDTELNMADFEEAAYVIKNFNEETKMRDVGQVEIDRFHLGWHMSQLVLNSRSKKHFLTRDEIIFLQKEGTTILEFFQGSKALEYSSNWINALYFFMLTDKINSRAWKKFEANVRNSIKNVQVSSIEDINDKTTSIIVRKMKRNLDMHFDICAATVLALNPMFSKKEKAKIMDLEIKLRRANLFNHYLVSFPLVNYADELEDNLDLTSVTPEDFQKLNIKIKNSRKSKYSPRFIYLEELFEFVFLKQAIRGGNYYLDSTKRSATAKISYIKEYFYDVNCINKSTAADLKINIEVQRKFDDYFVQRIQLGDKQQRKDSVRIAIANVKLDTKRCCYGLRGMDDIRLKRTDLIRFMEGTYRNGDNEKVDFLLLPEFYMPLQWIADILSFVRKTGITVISGLQYVTCGERAFNNVAVFAPVKAGKYSSAVLLVREKNDYAPLEYEILALKKYRCFNQEIPNYQIISNNGLDYGIFLCYEFTDIVARSLYKNEIDILFTPEQNTDTSYFSNIIETTARDLHAFVVQANTSIYGDSRITGPYGKDFRDIVKIKGGDCDEIIIGTIDLGKIRTYQLAEKKLANEKVEKFFLLDSKARYQKAQEYLEDKEPKISKTAARFNTKRFNA